MNNEQDRADRVQGGLTEREIKELWYRNFRSEFDGYSIGFAEDIFRAILSRQLPAPASRSGDAGGDVAWRDVLAERQRQMQVEGWTPEHDDKYHLGELATAAACYALTDNVHMPTDVPQFWPWSTEWWKPGDERRNLVKAGALILAEIERLDRASHALDATLSRQSMMGGEAEMVMNAITEGQKRRASESREPAGNMTAEFPPHAAILQDPGEIDERAAFEKFMSKRGWAAVYAGDGLYEMPSVQQQWEVWQGRAAVAAPQQQAERARVLEGFALVPLVMTKAMRQVTDEEDWQWEDLLAAAEAINEEQYNDIAAAPLLDTDEQEGNAAEATKSLISSMPLPDGCSPGYNGCTCACHRMPGVKHIMPCCYTTTPANAAAANGDGSDNRMPIKSERKAAEHEYSITAFDYAKNPIGSRDWTLYWAGWLARSTTKEPAADGQKGDVVAWRMVTPDQGAIVFITDASEAERFKNMDGREVRPLVFGDADGQKGEAA